MNTHPLKKQVPTAQVGTELVMLTSESSQAVCLNQVSAMIWNLCDGRTSTAAIAEAASGQLQAPVTEEVVRFALRELDARHLLEPRELPQVPALSRRELVRRLGTGAAVLLPLATMVAIPRKAQASGPTCVPPYCGGGCVPADTPIQLADGSWIPASAVRAGMWLYAFDALTSAPRVGRVEGVRTLAAPGIHTLFTERGDMLQSSPTHLLITGMGDMEGTAVEQMRAGDRVMVYESEVKPMVSTQLTGIHRSNLPSTVYGIEMASLEHTYVSAGLVSHNVSIKSVPVREREQWMRDAEERRQSAAEPLDAPDDEQ